MKEKPLIYVFLTLWLTSNFLALSSFPYNISPSSFKVLQVSAPCSRIGINTLLYITVWTPNPFAFLSWRDTSCCFFCSMCYPNRKLFQDTFTIQYFRFLSFQPHIQSFFFISTHDHNLCIVHFHFRSISSYLMRPISPLPQFMTFLSSLQYTILSGYAIISLSK